ncbi:prepilin-type N-terminal cleavage/methylation domain-containing protein [Kiritimatiella glycovorans]|uniref:Type II secretion system protein G n=1 Tax=Kiritimatiella glycovorans TaxID=1307763 RepID=A0A0G3ELF6_9BACT|nr:prepilin-type N-terminal cleavage/methylation domain-containing protein [Kiritimatiella glycovorans]AKJ65610.1 type II secretion system protein G [Kiritimatiella glycovorans]
MNRDTSRGFTLIELLVVLTLVILLITLLGPAAARLLEYARSSRCQANLRVLYSANAMYAADHQSYVPAAADMWGEHGDCWRWHGWRPNRNSDFIPGRGPLAPYLGQGGVVRDCPSFEGHRAEGQWNPSFESGGGGYGYNQYGVGSRYFLSSNGFYDFEAEPWARGMPPHAIREPASTLMFADCAFLKQGELIEYSFAEPSREPTFGVSLQPSIHFRHAGRAHVLWCDGHITGERMNDLSGGAHREHALGWFGPEDDSVFKPF